MIDKILTKLGIPYRLTGYRVLRRLIELTIEADKTMTPAKKLYEVIEAESGASKYSIEKNARTAVMHAWKTNPELVKKIVGDGCTAPTVTNFCAEVSRFILQQQQRQ